MTLLRTRPSLLTLNKSINNNEFSDTLVHFGSSCVMDKFDSCKNPTNTSFWCLQAILPSKGMIVAWILAPKMTYTLLQLNFHFNEGTKCTYMLWYIVIFNTKSFLPLYDRLVRKIKLGMYKKFIKGPVLWTVHTSGKQNVHNIYKSSSEQSLTSWLLKHRGVINLEI